jgi:hypothetical protein
VNPPLISQVSATPEYLNQSKKEEKNKENYLAFFDSKKRKKDRHKLDRKTRY